MFELVLHQPEIPQNTGNLIRLCANTGCRLHLVRPLGFRIDDKQLRRAGLDYHELAMLRIHESYAHWRAEFPQARVWAFSTRGLRRHGEADFRGGDALLFGSESRGLPREVLEPLPPEQVLRIPMRAASRSLNLANAAAIAVYEAWRQNGYAGA